MSSRSWARIAPSRMRALAPWLRGLSTRPGTAKTTRPCSAASRAVISEPLRRAASTTSTPSASPEMMRFRVGKLPPSTVVRMGSSETSAPRRSARICSNSWAVLGRVDLAQPAAHHRDGPAAAGQGTAVGGGVDAARPAADDREARPPEQLAEPLGLFQPVVGAAAAADDGHRDGVGRFQLPSDVEHRGRVGDVGQGGGVARIFQGQDRRPVLLRGGQFRVDLLVASRPPGPAAVLSPTPRTFASRPAPRRRPTPRPQRPPPAAGTGSPRSPRPGAVSGTPAVVWLRPSGNPHRLRLASSVGRRPSGHFGVGRGGDLGLSATGLAGQVLAEEGDGPRGVLSGLGDDRLVVLGVLDDPEVLGRRGRLQQQLGLVGADVAVALAVDEEDRAGPACPSGPCGPRGSAGAAWAGRIASAARPGTARTPRGGSRRPAARWRRCRPSASSALPSVSAVLKAPSQTMAAMLGSLAAASSAAPAPREMPKTPICVLRPSAARTDSTYAQAPRTSSSSLSLGHWSGR